MVPKKPSDPVPRDKSGSTLPISDQRLSKAEERLGHVFKNKDLLARALCHASTRNEGIVSNERLEFLGDAVLGLLVSWFLFEGLPDADQGALSSRRARMTRGEHLAKVGERLKLGELLRTGKNQDLEPTRGMESDLVEACLGAIFMDGGLEAAQAFVLNHVIAQEPAASAEAPAYTDSKSQLQHFTLARRLGLPTYRQIHVEGPPHAQEFTMEVVVADKILGTGKGTSKKAAQQAAATVAFDALRKADAGSTSTGADDAEDGGASES